MNRSKSSETRNPHHWRKMRAAGSVEGMDAARRRQREKLTRVESGDTVTIESEAHGIHAGYTSVPEAARVLGVHPTTVRRRLARGTYQGVQDTNGVWTIQDKAIVEAVAKANRQGA